MGDEAIRLEIDGEDATDECERVDFATPRLVYEEDNGRSALRFLGPQGFQITLINPSNRLRTLVDGGVAVHQVKITCRGLSLTNPVQFHKEWDASGVQKVFGCRPVEPQTVATWVPEPEQQPLVNQQ